MTLAVSVSVAGALPLLEPTESQELLLEVVKLSVPPPVFDTFTEAGAGLVGLFCVPLNETLVAESDKTGCGGATMNVTGIIAGEPCAPVALTVI